MKRRRGWEEEKKLICAKQYFKYLHQFNELDISVNFTFSVRNLRHSEFIISCPSFYSYSMLEAEINFRSLAQVCTFNQYLF